MHPVFVCRVLSVGERSVDSLYHDSSTYEYTMHMLSRCGDECWVMCAMQSSKFHSAETGCWSWKQRFWSAVWVWSERGGMDCDEDDGGGLDGRHEVHEYHFDNLETGTVRLLIAGSCIEEW